MTRQVWIRKTNASEPLLTRREPVPDIETGEGGTAGRSLGVALKAAQAVSGVQVA